MNVADWLRALGLGQYEATFRENSVTVDLLPNLTPEDLKDLGITLVGHRRRLLDSISALRADANRAEDPRAASAERHRPARQSTAERRQLSVMFCDLIGSTPLSSRLDPEELSAVLRGYQARVAAIIQRFGGFIARYVGDGILIYFGWPEAYEADAERAVRAALAVTDAIAQAPVVTEPLRVRIGIATGLVVVGEPIDTDEGRQQTAIGETPNLAARLQNLAGPNGIVIDAATRQQIGGFFKFRDLGTIALKGLPNAVPAWEVLEEAAVESRFEALHAEIMTPLVGRQEELELLQRRWLRATSGEGQVVLLSGEPGIGKSRLIVELEQRIAAGTHVSLRYSCSPLYQDSPLRPVIACWEHAASFARGDGSQEKLRKLEAMLLPGGTSAEELALIADLLSVPTEGRYPKLESSPQRKKEKLFEALNRWLAGLARTNPVLLLFEDAHWADATTLELLETTIDRLAELPVLLVNSFRPEFSAPWIGRPGVSLIALSRLDRRDSAALAARVTRDHALPEGSLDRIVTQTDGVPLFLEELTKATIEQAAAPDRGRTLVNAVPGAGTVPATLQSSLMARLDRLGTTAREVAQVGAAIGREFTFELLATVEARDPEALQVALSRVVSAGLVFRRGTPPQATYLFKHALVQDVAYGSLLRERRRLLHGRIADALLEPESAAAPEIVAHHLQEADRASEAIGYWREAGEQAVRRAANSEAIEHFRHALGLLAAQPEADRRWRSELAVLSQLVPALMNVHGSSAPEAGEASERAAAVGRRLGNSADIAPSIANLWVYEIARLRLDRAEEISADLFRIARDLDSAEILLQGYHCAWPMAWHRGHFVKASEQIEAGLRLYDEQRHAHHRNLYLGHDPAVCALGINASVQFALGYLDRASRLEGEAISLADRLQHKPSLAFVLFEVCDARAARKDASGICPLARRLFDLSESEGLAQARGQALMYLGWAQALSGDAPGGIAKLREASESLRRIGHQLSLIRVDWLMAEALIAAGRHAEGLQEVDRTIEIAAKAGVGLFEARLHQARAELLLHVGPDSVATAEASLRQALAIARRQGAKGYELQAATRLADMWSEQTKRAEARDLLTPIYEWFTEGLADPVLRAAKALLDAL